VKQVVDALPGSVTLRGSDWARLGFDARSTSFRRGSRMDDYRKYRVALDLGSKSTHAALYPRTADIMAVGGGIVQFDSGEGSPEWSCAPLRRRASTWRGRLARGA